MAFYGVRSLYHFGVKPDGTNIFEERIVCFLKSFAFRPRGGH